jgi:hypothetical protein
MDLAVRVVAPPGLTAEPTRLTLRRGGFATVDVRVPAGAGPFDGSIRFEVTPASEARREPFLRSLPVVLVRGVLAAEKIDLGRAAPGETARAPLEARTVTFEDAELIGPGGGRIPICVSAAGVVATVSPDAPPGVYGGAISARCGTSRRSVPVTLAVVAPPPPPPAPAPEPPPSAPAPAPEAVPPPPEPAVEIAPVATPVVARAEPPPAATEAPAPRPEPIVPKPVEPAPAPEPRTSYALVGSMIALGALALGAVLGVRRARLARLFGRRQLRGIGSNGRLSYERYLLHEHRDSARSAVVPPGPTAIRVVIDGQSIAHAFALEGSQLVVDGGAPAPSGPQLAHGTRIAVLRGLYVRRYVYLERDPTAEELVALWDEERRGHSAQEPISDLIVVLDEHENMVPPSARLVALDSARLPDVRGLTDDSDESVVIADSDESAIIDLGSNGANDDERGESVRRPRAPFKSP